MQERARLVFSRVLRPSRGVVLSVEKPQNASDEAVLRGVGVYLRGTLWRLEEPHSLVGGIAQDNVIEVLVVEIVVSRHAAQIDADVIPSRSHCKVGEHTRCPNNQNDS